MVIFLHRKPVSAGKSSDSCSAEWYNKMNSVKVCIVIPPFVQRQWCLMGSYMCNCQNGVSLREKLFDFLPLEEPGLAGI